MDSKKLEQRVLKAVEPLADFFSKTSWKAIKALFNKGLYYKMKEVDHNLLRLKLSENHYIVLTGGHPTLSSVLIKLASLYKTGKWPLFTHALMNIDDYEDPLQSDKFQLIEATGIRGVAPASFMEVFDCDVAALLRPKKFSPQDWDAAVKVMRDSIGKEYDAMFNFDDESTVSCVELVRLALEKHNPDYRDDFPNFEAAIKNEETLVAQMFFENEDFEVILFINRTND